MSVWPPDIPRIEADVVRQDIERSTGGVRSEVDMYLRRLREAGILGSDKRDELTPPEEAAVLRIEEAKGLYQDLTRRSPAKDFLYEIVLPNLNGWQVPPLCFAGGTFPFSNYSDYTQISANSVTYYPGSYDVSDVELECYEFEDGEVANFFNEWERRIRNPQGFYNLPKGENGFKQTIQVFRLNTIGVRVFGLEYEGCWPKTLSPYSPKADGRDVVRFSVTLSADGVKRVL